MTTPAFEARATTEAEEYGTFRAVCDIYFDGAVAYRAGMAVPASNVLLHGYEADSLVERVTPPAVEAPAEAPAAE